MPPLGDGDVSTVGHQIDLPLRAKLPHCERKREVEVFHVTLHQCKATCKLSIGKRCDQTEGGTRPTSLLEIGLIRVIKNTCAWKLA